MLQWCCYNICWNVWDVKQALFSGGGNAKSMVRMLNECIGDYIDLKEHTFKRGVVYNADIIDAAVMCS